MRLWLLLRALRSRDKWSAQVGVIVGAVESLHAGLSLVELPGREVWLALGCHWCEQACACAHDFSGDALLYVHGLLEGGRGACRSCLLEAIGSKLHWTFCLCLVDDCLGKALESESDCDCSVSLRATKYDQKLQVL